VAAILAQNCVKKVKLLEYLESMEAIYKIELADFPCYHCSR
jgi:tartrate dehydratase beta subunit/fumarate hydratase class I family protein